MTAVPIKSSFIASADYDEEAQRLTVEFRNGRVYSHEGVPKSAYEAMIDAPSVGRYYSMYVRMKY